MATPCRLGVRPALPRCVGTCCRWPP